MIASNSPPVRCRPPTKPAIRRSPVSRWALRTTFTAPAWEQPETITSPLSFTFTITFWSSQIIGSGSQPPFEAA
jgi:hypothetical protein